LSNENIFPSFKKKIKKRHDRCTSSILNTGSLFEFGLLPLYSSSQARARLGPLATTSLSVLHSFATTPPDPRFLAAAAAAGFILSLPTSHVAPPPFPAPSVRRVGSVEVSVLPPSKLYSPSAIPSGFPCLSAIRRLYRVDP
jgi:hypothetical protein